MKPSVRLFVAGDVNWPQTALLKWYQVIRMAQEVQTLRERAAVLRYTYIDHLVCFIFLSIRNYMPWSGTYRTEYAVRRKEDSTVVMFVCQLMDIALVRAVTGLRQLN